MKQIICLSHSRWSARPNRTQQLLTRLDDAQVLFFEPPAPAQDRDARTGLRVRSNVTVYPLPLPLSALAQPWLRRRGLNRVTRYIQSAMTVRRFREPVMWCTSPDNAFMIDQLAYRCLVYDCHREWDRLPLEWESELAIAADVIFAASPGLRRRLAPCSDNIALLPNGANPLMFLRDGLVPPALVSRLTAPVFARVGDLPADLEIEPLMAAAQRYPQWTFLMLGRVNQTIRQYLSALPNVILAGSVPAVELPDYLSGCDVLFDLLRRKRRGCDVIPCRVFEYLSTGKPIVTMVEPELVEPFPDAIYTAYDVNGFLRQCQCALAENNPDVPRRRLEYAREAAWSQRAREVANILNATGLL